MSDNLPQVAAPSAGALLMDDSAMDRLERIADLMSSGKTTVPAHLRGSKGDCFAICLQSMQWGMNPFAVAQKTHLVNGIMGYEAQLVAAIINSSGAVKDRFNFEFYGSWDRVIGKFLVKKGEKGEYRVPGWTFADEEGCGVRVFATLKGESQPRVLDLLLAQARVRNSTLWADDPKQQLAYLGQKKWSRLYAPDVILGVYTADEMADPAEKNMGAAVIVEPAPPKREAWTAEAFDAILPKLLAGIQKGKSIEDALAWLRAKADLSAEQEAVLRASVSAVMPTDVDPATGEIIPSPAEIEAMMMAAKDLDSLYIAADLIHSMANNTIADTLRVIFQRRESELHGAL